QLAAESGQTVQRLRLDAAGGAERNELAVAMAEHRVSANAKTLQDVKRSKLHRAKGRLGRLRGAEGGGLFSFPSVIKCRSWKDQVGHPLGTISRPIRRLQRVEHFGEEACQVAQHADVLGALAGKEQGERAGRRAVAEKNSFS